MKYKGIYWALFVQRMKLCSNYSTAYCTARTHWRAAIVSAITGWLAIESKIRNEGARQLSLM